MSKHKKRTYLQSRICLLSFFLNAVMGSLLNIVALNYTPQSVVLQLSATTLMGNTILATRYLNEAMEVQDCLGVLLVLLGSVGTILVGPKEAHDPDGGGGGHYLDTFTVTKLQYRWRDTPFLVLFWSLVLLIAIDVAALKVLDRVNRRMKAELWHRDFVLFEGKDTGERTIVHLSCFCLISYLLIAASAERNSTFYLTYVHIKTAW